MNLNQLRKQFPDEDACRQFFESARWPSGRICPHCEHKESWVIKATGALRDVVDGRPLIGPGASLIDQTKWIR